MTVVKIREARGSKSVISFGPNLRNDEQAKWGLFKASKSSAGEGVTMKLVEQGRVPRKGRVRFELDDGFYMVMAQGALKAGMVHTADKVMEAPFYLSIDAQPLGPGIREQKPGNPIRILSRAIDLLLRT